MVTAETCGHDTGAIGIVGCAPWPTSDETSRWRTFGPAGAGKAARDCDAGSITTRDISESTSRRRCGPCSVILILIFAQQRPPRQQHQTRTGLPPLSQPVRAAGVTPSPTMAVQRIQQGRRHRSCCSTREDRTPSHAPGLLCPQPPPWTFTSSTCSGKLARDYRPLTFSPRAPGTHSRNTHMLRHVSAAHSCRTANSSDLKRLHTDVEEIECWTQVAKSTCSCSVRHQLAWHLFGFKQRAEPIWRTFTNTLLAQWPL